MTRAEEILALCEVVASKPGMAFKGQYRYNPGAKKPVHLKMRQDKRAQMAQRVKKTNQRPWANKQLPRDKISRPLDKMSPTTDQVVKRTS